MHKWLHCLWKWKHSKTSCFRCLHSTTNWLLKKQLWRLLLTSTSTMKFSLRKTSKLKQNHSKWLTFLFKTRNLNSCHRMWHVKFKKKLWKSLWLLVQQVQTCTSRHLTKQKKTQQTCHFTLKQRKLKLKLQKQFECSLKRKSRKLSLLQ